MSIYIFQRSLVRLDTNTEFFYNSPYEWNRDNGEDRLSPRLYTMETPGADGEYQENISPYGPRLFAVKGRIIAADPLDLQTKTDTLYGAHPNNTLCKLYRRLLAANGVTVVSSRYLFCRVAYVVRPNETGLNYCDWEIGLRSPDPLYRENTVQAQSLNFTNGGTNTTTWTPGGEVPALPQFVFTVTHSGVLSLSSTGNAAACVVTLGGTGTLVIDSSVSPDAITLNGVSILGNVSGQFLALSQFSQTVTITLSSGCTLSGTPAVNYQKRHQFS